MYGFQNIDSFRPQRFEKVGILKGKRWYIDTHKKRTGLFKPQRNEFKDRKVFCANHYGEAVGYILAVRGGNEACETSLAHLTRYYPNIYKERNGANPEEKYGCIIYSKLRRGDNLEPGEVTIEKFKEHNRELFKEIIKNDGKFSKANDNIELILSAIEFRTRSFYNLLGNKSEDYIQSKILTNKKRMINQIVYDCLYGNYDRHDENWSMHLKQEGDIDVYPLYDNEKVMGLYENMNFIRSAIGKHTIEKDLEEKFFSRMRVPGEKKANSTYKDVMRYLLEKYPEETMEMLKMKIEKNTPEAVRGILENCEKLPKEYIDFGTKMYGYRYDFIRKLYEKNKNFSNEQSFEPELESKGEER